ncbi:Rho-binding antiterminator [Vibrio cionasavignyae]|uniref:Rho-binding antiterminator n=1 Tax=Vibrio cionasavignyae TaxID=2910252 RepID=UPI003D108DC0
MQKSPTFTTLPSIANKRNHGVITMPSCSHYDQLELLCLYRYPIRIAYKIQSQSGHHDEVMEVAQDIEGIAIDILRNEHKEECVKIHCKGADSLIVLSRISRIDVLNDNPHITSIVMTELK